MITTDAKAYGTFNGHNRPSTITLRSRFAAVLLVVFPLLVIATIVNYNWLTLQELQYWPKDEARQILPVEKWSWWCSAKNMTVPGWNSTDPAFNRTGCEDGYWKKVPKTTLDQMMWAQDHNRKHREDVLMGNLDTSTKMHAETFKANNTEEAKRKLDVVLKAVAEMVNYTLGGS